MLWFMVANVGTGTVMIWSVENPSGFGVPHCTSAYRNSSCVATDGLKVNHLVVLAVRHTQLSAVSKGELLRELVGVGIVVCQAAVPKVGYQWTGDLDPAAARASGVRVSLHAEARPKHKQKATKFKDTIRIGEISNFARELPTHHRHTALFTGRTGW
jgi:hypothetical protein